MKALPRTVVALGITSLLMDVSSELVHSLLPVYLTAVLGASMVAVGLVEGVAEATASIVKMFSGALSDRLNRRKPIALVGYALSALSTVASGRASEKRLLARADRLLWRGAT